MMIKKIVIAMLFFFAVCTSAFSQAPGLITGTWEGKNIKKVFLFKVEDGVLHEVASSGLTEKKEFGILLNAEHPGFYVLGQSAQKEALNFTFYMKPGDKLSLAIHDGDYALTGDNTPENKEMERWHHIVKALAQHAYHFTAATYVDFFPLLDEAVIRAGDYKPEYMLDATFAEKFRFFRHHDLMYLATKFLYTPHSAHPQDEDMPDYYKGVSLAAISGNASILDYPYGLSLLRLVRMHASMQASKQLSGEVRKDFFAPYACLDRDLPQIDNERLKGEAVLSLAYWAKTFEGLKDVEQRYGKYLTTERQKARFKQALVAKSSNERGQDAFDFKFKDVNGKEFALSDFKGKVVYVDVWATWCAPCREELPYLKELQKDYEGKNIVFIGVSSDKVKDYNKWVTFLKDYSMSGVQLFAGERRDDIMVPYKINAIPRFLLFGKDGKIVSSTAPRPSSLEIRPLLDELLKK